MKDDQTDPVRTHIDQVLNSLPGLPGVYKMLNEQREIIYVGKAKNLKKRVLSYFQKSDKDLKTHSLVKNITDIETIVTHTEGEALLLENNLIKQHKPRYNILYRDDKSYPYIYLSTEHPFPRLSFHRGACKGKGRYFGPYPSAGAVRDSLQQMQKLFTVRQCTDTFYKNRSRPCLQYQIKRCLAPCVDLVSKADYAKEVEQAILFLEGKNSALIENLAQQMEDAATQLDYERAALLRDRISNLRSIQEKQYISGDEGDYDVIAAAIQADVSCVQRFKIRNGHNLGNKAYYPKKLSGQNESDLINAFIAQHYLAAHGRHKIDLPTTILITEQIDDINLLEKVLSEQNGKNISIKHNVRGSRAKWLKMALQNATLAVSARIATHASVLSRFEALQQVFNLDELPNRLECFDISHSMGEATVASCVVFNHEGAKKSDYRRYNIKNITPGDDYAAMEQALMRRYRKKQENEMQLPDILFIDGGKGQLGRAKQVMEELQINDILLVGVAKGPSRKPGLENLIVADGLSEKDTEFILPPDSPALHLIQQIRDEAHRFAISGHRNQRKKARSRSALEDIEGLGPKRRQSLLTQFGGLREVAKAGVDDLARIPGISKQLAKKIYDRFHSDT